MSFFEEAMKSSSIYEADEDVDVDYEYWSSNHNGHATVSIRNSLHNKSFTVFKISVESFRCTNSFNLSQTWRNSENGDSRCW
jgi:hypothetical protein